MRASKFINKLAWPINALRYKGIKDIHSRKEFYKIIEQERERANRNNHQVSLVIFNMESFPDDSKERKLLVKNIVQEKRKIDQIGWYQKHSVGVILPYTSFRGARMFSVRLSRKLNFILPDSFCQLYSYPLQNNIEDITEHKSSSFTERTENGVDNSNDEIESAEDDNKTNTNNTIKNIAARGISE